MAYTTIDKPTDYFNTITYTGNDTDERVITGVGFQSDWTWVKARSSAFSHYIIDAIRYDAGASKYLKLDSSYTGADETPSAAGWISTLNSDGYVCKNGSSNTDNCNENSVTYVAWNWLGANGTASNGSGSITSTVSANATAGFSIVSYTGNGTAGATVGHGIDTPKMIIVKKRSGVSTWNVYHEAIGNTKGLYLNTTDNPTTYTGFWNDTSPTSSVFSVGADNTTNTATYIAYCFAEKKGYSKFGSYTGNGNADNTFCYLGFKPAMVIIKKTSGGADGWYMFDNKRDTHNPEVGRLESDSSGAEYTGLTAGWVDFLSNGFKVITTSGGVGASETYVFMAFAESPFVNSNGVPNNAR